MRRVAACLALLAAGALAEPPLERIVAKVDQRTAAQLFLLGQRAEKQGLHRTARLQWERVLELAPDHVAARALLGFTRKGRTWTRTAAAQRDMEAREDADPKRAARFPAERRQIEAERLDEIVRVCAKYGTQAEKEAILHPLLERMPYREDIHRALGHPKVGRVYVRPGLADLVKRMPLQVAAWHLHVREAVAPAPIEPPFAVPGLAPPPAFFDAEGRAVACTLDPDAALRVARDVARTQRLLGWILGRDTPVWNPSPVLFLQPEPYRALVRTLHPDERAFKLYHRFGNYEHGDFYAIRVWSAVDAGERYAHGAGYMTMYELAAPELQGRKDTRAHAWLLEGFGYLLAFELFDRGHVSYVSLEESAKKRAFTRPPPGQRTRAACLAWVREQMLAGRACTLRQVCARGLNDLDFCASMQAYAFVRFLLLYDPEAFRKLPAALRTKPLGAQAGQVDRALEETYGRGLAEFAPLWRAFVLEVAQG